MVWGNYYDSFSGDPMCFVHVLLNALNMRQSGLDVALVIEGLPPTDKDEIIDIMGAMASFLEDECHGEVIRYNISASNPEIEIHL